MCSGQCSYAHTRGGGCPAVNGSNGSQDRMDNLAGRSIVSSALYVEARLDVKNGASLPRVKEDILLCY